MEIDLTADLPASEWDRLFAQDEAASFFHTREWTAAITDTIPGWQRTCLVARQGGRIVAVLPFMVRRRLGLRVMASMPFGGYGGVLSPPGTPGGVHAALAGRFFELAMRAGVAYAEVVDVPARFVALARAGVRAAEIETHRLDLSGGLDTVWSRFKPSTRNKIRRAQRERVRIRRALSPEDFERYHNIHRICSLEWGRRPAPAAFFHRLSALDPRRVQMWIAERDGAAVAALLNFVHGDSVLNWGSVALAEGKQHAATNLLHGVAIESAIALGLREYNFGSNPGLDGVARFKGSFGAATQRHPVYRLESPWYRALRRLRRPDAAFTSRRRSGRRCPEAARP